jgi:hypothetical protein
MTLGEIESQLSSLFDQDLMRLKQAAAEAGVRTQERIRLVQREISECENFLAELNEEVQTKEKRESLHMSQIQNEQLSELLRAQIDIPESQLKLYWNHLKLRLEPGGSFGGVRVTLGFLNRLADLRFSVKYQENAYVVSECDPLIIGLAELVEQLNSDSRAGALARFVCRIRSRYTAQYSDEF